MAPPPPWGGGGWGGGGWGGGGGGAGGGVCLRACLRACARARVRAAVHACARVWVRGHIDCVFLWSCSCYVNACALVRVRLCLSMGRSVSALQVDGIHVWLRTNVGLRVPQVWCAVRILGHRASPRRHGPPPILHPPHSTGNLKKIYKKKVTAANSAVKDGGGIKMNRCWDSSAGDGIARHGPRRRSDGDEADVPSAVADEPCLVDEGFAESPGAIIINVYS